MCLQEYGNRCRVTRQETEFFECIEWNDPQRANDCRQCRIESLDDLIRWKLSHSTKRCPMLDGRHIRRKSA